MRVYFNQYQCAINPREIDQLPKSLNFTISTFRQLLHKGEISGQFFGHWSGGWGAKIHPMKAFNTFFHRHVKSMIRSRDSLHK